MGAVFRRDGRERLTVADGQRNAAQVIGKLWPGVALTGLTKGQFSILDVILACLDSTGPADLVVSTWTTSPGDAERLARLAADGRLRSVSLLVDRSFATCRPDYHAFVLGVFGAGSVKVTKTHAKFALLWNDAWNVCIRSSMNLNHNPRFEQFDLDDSPDLLAFFREHVDAIQPEHHQAAVQMGFDRLLGEPSTAAERAEARVARAAQKSSAEAVLARHAALIPEAG